jgi:hypothetical protein
MKTREFLRMVFLGLVILMIQSSLWSQSKYSAKDNINMIISGTSTMHDWEMKSSKGECKTIFNLDNDGKLKDISEMTFSILVKSLKSGKGGMDKNAYKALKADQFQYISATIKSCDIKSLDNKNYTANSIIKLVIAGKTVETDLVTQIKRINDTSFSVKGEKKISMKDYGVEPPSFMLGAVKTGNDIVLNFDLILNQ